MSDNRYLNFNSQGPGRLNYTVLSILWAMKV